MTIDAAKDCLREHWPNIRTRLLEGTYQPQPVKRVEIPKPDGGIRKLGVPCVVDRLIQQAMLQVLQERWDPTFSDYSYGFRPGRSAHQAVAQAQRYIADGYNVVVDLDLEKFFDRVNHDSLMARVAARVSDKRVLKLIRAFLNAGVMGVYRTRFFGQAVGLCGAPERLVMPSGASVVRASVAVLLDQPFGVVAGGEGADGVSDVVDGLEDTSVHDLLLEGSEQALDDAIIRYEGISASTLVRSSGRRYGETIRVLGRWKHESAGRPT